MLADMAHLLFLTFLFCHAFLCLPHRFFAPMSASGSANPDIDWELLKLSSSSSSTSPASAEFSRSGSGESGGGFLQAFYIVEY